MSRIPASLDDVRYGQCDWSQLPENEIGQGTGALSILDFAYCVIQTGGHCGINFRGRRLSALDALSLALVEVSGWSVGPP